MKKCFYCGKENDDNSRYCSVCGSDLDNYQQAVVCYNHNGYTIAANVFLGITAFVYGFNLLILALGFFMNVDGVSMAELTFSFLVLAIFLGLNIYVLIRFNNDITIEGKASVLVKVLLIFVNIIALILVLVDKDHN